MSSWTNLSVVGLVSVEEVHELLEEEPLGVDLLVDALVNAVDDEGHGAHQARPQHAAVALVAHLDLGRLVNHRVGAKAEIQMLRFSWSKLE